MSAFGKAWKVLKNENDPLIDPLSRIRTQEGINEYLANPLSTSQAFTASGNNVLNEYGDSQDPVNDAHAHFYADDVVNDFDERYDALRVDVFNHLENVWNSYKEDHPEWDPHINPDTRTDREGPPGATELGALIEEMAEKFDTRLPW